MTKAALAILTSVLTILVAAGITYSLTYARAVEREVSSHEKLAGHPTVVAQLDAIDNRIESNWKIIESQIGNVRTMQKTMGEDIKLLLRRSVRD